MATKAKRYEQGLWTKQPVHDKLEELKEIIDWYRRMIGPENAERLKVRIKDLFESAKIYGIALAADVAKDYDKTNSHPYLVSDCILGKLNVRKGKPRRNYSVLPR